MAAPEPYTRLNAYTDWSANNPGDPHLGQDFDEDFDDVARFSREILERLALLQRDDGKLASGAIDSEAQFDAAFLAQLKADIASIGLSGIQGPVGPQGDPGPAGVQGPPGPPLPWIVSTGVPSSNIGVANQVFLNVSNGDVYQKGANSWVLLGNIRGPAGAGGGGVSDHGMLLGLSDPDHPISAVQGLQQALDDLETAIALTGLAQKNVYRQPSPPSANLNAGDLWFDSDAGDRLYRWDGTQWVDVADKRIDTALVNAGNAILAAAGAQATADGKVTTFYSSSNPANPRLGDLWIRTDQGNRLYRWDGSAWVNVQDRAIQEAIEAANDAQATADGKIESFFSPTAPVGASLGDLWFDTDDGNHPYRFNGAQWISIRDAAIDQAAAQAAQAIATASQALAEVDVIADGVVEVFYQSNQPNDAGVGDLWINTSLGNQLHRYNGSQWVSVQDTAVQQALTNAALAQATADGKVRAFYQSSAPSAASGRQTGDLWFDTDDQFRPYRFNGSAWQDISYIVGVQGGLITGVSIANGVITADKLNVSTLSSITANIGTITAGVLQSSNGAAKFDLNNARIIFNNGSVMLVQGLGFGSSGQFIEWFGPSLSNLNQCTEANAITYKKIDGDAYFGGSLSAGTLFSSISTSDLSPNAQVILGPFGTNGNPIAITVSYIAQGAVLLPFSSEGTFENSGTVQLYRKIGTGDETLVRTFSLSGVCRHEPAGDFDHSHAFSNLSGSITYTDTAGGTQDRTYRAVIVERNMHHGPVTQRLSIQSTEE